MAKDEFGMPVHPVCEIVPLMDEVALERLVEDIRENGLRVPLWTYNGMLVDGRNRLTACRLAGVKPRFQEWDGKGSLVKFAWSLNGARRDLTAGQRAAAAVLMLPILEAEAAERRTATQGRPSKEKLSQKVDSVSDRNAGKAAAEAAKMTGANRTYVADAKKIKTEAPEEFEKLRTGISTIAQATRTHKEQQAKKDSKPRPKKRPKPYKPENPHTRYRKRIIAIVEACTALPQPVDIKKIAEMADLTVHNMKQNATISCWSLLPWVEITPVPNSTSYHFKIDRYLRAVCEDRVPRFSIAHAKWAEEAKSLITFYGDLRREITRQRNEAKAERDASQWTPTATIIPQVHNLLNFIETKLDEHSGPIGKD